MKSRNNDFSERVIVMIINIANHGLKSIIINRKESSQYTVHYSTGHTATALHSSEIHQWSPETRIIALN